MTARHRAFDRFARALRAALVALLACAALTAAANHAAAAPKGGFIVFEAETGRVLNAVRSRVRLHPASLTKMMTLYLAFEALENRKITLHQRIRTSRHAASMPAMELGLRRGDVVSVRDAIRSAAVHSANDAAVALAEALGGTEKNFARMMTAKARDLGMHETTFKNATGFTAKGHLTTARDMGILARRLWLDFPQHYEVFSNLSVKVGGRRYRATNGLLGEPGVDGIKTGYTRAAGYNLAASAARKGKRVTVVLMGGRSKNRRNKAVKALLDDGFERLEKLPPQAPTPRRRPGRRAGGYDMAAPKSAPAPRPRPAGLNPASPETAMLAARRRKHQQALGSRWAVQLGSFFRRSEAREMMRTLLGQGAPGLDSGYRAIVTGRVKNRAGEAVTVHRVRFTGLDEASARAACRALKRRRTPCALVPPQGWGG